MSEGTENRMVRSKFGHKYMRKKMLVLKTTKSTKIKWKMGQYNAS